MEKLLYLLPGDSQASGIEQAVRTQARALAEHTLGLTLLTRKPSSTGASPFRAVLCVWLACLDRRGPLEHGLAQLGAAFHAYLVTESLLRGARGPVAQQSEATLVAIHQTPRLGQEEFRVELSRSLSPCLERQACSDRIVRDSVVRPLDAAAPPLRALFTFVHGSRAEGPELSRAFDGLCTAAQRSLVVMDRQIVRPRAAR